MVGFGGSGFLGFFLGHSDFAHEVSGVFRVVG
jgi:hypothetical protein